jgi:asparagine synthetase B (glutamine-hydrolysing)
MCGILLVVEGRGHGQGEVDDGDAERDARLCGSARELFERWIEPRGPDASRFETLTLGASTLSGPPASAWFGCSVLSLRGTGVEPQPLERAWGWLGFNGEVFGGDLHVEAHASDTVAVANAIESAINDGGVLPALADGRSGGGGSCGSGSGGSGSSGSGSGRTAAALERIEGPFALVGVDAKRGRIICARDRLGRRSLCWRRLCGGGVAISSVALDSVSSGEVQEGAEAVEDEDDMDPDAASPGAADVTAMQGALGSHLIGAEGAMSWPLFGSKDGKQVIGSEWTEIPPFGVFSIDLASGLVTLDAYRSWDLTAALRGSARALAGPGPEEMAQVSTDSTCTDPAMFSAGLAARVASLLSVLEHAVRVRLVDDRGGPASPVGILFSGGVDCTVLALLAHRCADPAAEIELINISFAADPERAPDRVTGRAGLAALERLAPERRWVFLAVNVDRAEIDAHRPRIAALMRPCDRVMDLSISTVFWFGARGIASDGRRARARYLLSGSGADEHLAGYSRHRHAMRGGWNIAADSVALDITRLWSRNLGYIDRVIADHGREARYPFLDEGTSGNDYTRLYLCFCRGK